MKKGGITMEKLRATEIIRCPARLLKAFNVNTDYLIFSSSPVNMPSPSPQKHTFVFVKKTNKQTKKTKQKTIQFFLQAAKVLS